MDFGGRRNMTMTGSKFSVVNYTVPQYKIKSGLQRIVIMPFPLTSKRSPRVFTGQCEIGQADWDFEVAVHKNIAGRTVLCPSTYGLPCPICENVNQLQDAAATDEEKSKIFKQLGRSRRAYFNILDLDDIGKGIQVMDVGAGSISKPALPQMLMQQQTIWDTDPDSQKLAPDAFFADIENTGLVVKIVGTPATINGNKYNKLTSVSFGPLSADDRETAKKFLHKVVLFDKCLDELMSYETLEGLYTGDMGDDTASTTETDAHEVSAHRTLPVETVPEETVVCPPKAKKPVVVEELEEEAPEPEEVPAQKPKKVVVGAPVKQILKDPEGEEKAATKSKIEWWMNDDDDAGQEEG